MLKTRRIKEQKKGIEGKQIREYRLQSRRKMEWKQLRREERIDMKRRQGKKLVEGVDSCRE